ncbi:glycosyltransferase [Candidatus Woesearchaeota archaeon]|nr:glycosyltransferase [Candidatus Woesearchaeota archaeon]
MDLFTIIAPIAAVLEPVFQQYAAFGRPVLDFLHVIFQGTFQTILWIAVLVSLLYYMMCAYVLLKGRGKRKETPVMGELPFVTVQIPTRNELVALRCAEHCLAFDYPKEKYEILIGDDSNMPEVSARLNEFAAAHPEMVRVLKRASNVGFKPGNLNNMLQHSRGEYIVIFDSDFVPKQDFLARIVQPFARDPSLAGVQARWNLLNANQNLVSALGATIVATCHHVGIPFMNRSTNIGFFCGSAEAVKKDVLVKLGGWESGALTEDIEFSMRLIRNGYRIEYLEDLECDSEVPFLIRDLYRQQMRWAYGVVSAYKKHFVGIATSKHLSIKDKTILGILFCTGYFLSVLLAALFVMGILSFITNPPAPIDIPLFMAETFKNIALTSGLVVTSFFALARANRLRLTVPMILSSFTYGLLVTYYVNVGIFKALFRAPMEWFLLNKQGNKLA